MGNSDINYCRDSDIGSCTGSGDDLVAVEIFPARVG